MGAKMETSRITGAGRLLRERHLLQSILPFSASTLWRKVRAGTFPAPIKLGPGITAWREKDIVDWLNQQSAGGQS
ncbi:MAG: AlpA family phage regulatory protein [Betaproteobacteria bacterium]|nr:AlpA family phage regulatory protein [Betaproteobacteria bacterium]